MKKTLLLSLTALMMTLLLSVSLNTSLGAQTKGSAAVSPGLQVIAHYTPIARAGLVGNEILFTPDDFERALNLSRVASVTITRSPDAADGELLIGSVKIGAGQTIPRANLGLLSFAAAADDVRSSSFSFAVNGSSYSINCSLYLLDKINYSPTTAGGGSLEVSTYRDIAAFGRFHALDPEGDKLTYQVVSYPRHGALILLGDDGRYVYMPDAGFTGKDKVTYVVSDKYGNYSAAATVTLKVEKNTASLAYDDMKWNTAYSAAIRLTGAGIMSGTQIGNGYYFYPNQTVSRAEFLVMAMRSAGVSNLPSVEDTGFYDDNDIPGAMKSYVGAAARAGYVQGSVVDGKRYFYPDHEITAAEAAIIVANIMGVKGDGSISVSVGAADVPAWAQTEVYALGGAGVIDLADYNFKSALTRAGAARMLAAMMRGLK